MKAQIDNLHLTIPDNTPDVRLQKLWKRIHTEGRVSTKKLKAKIQKEGRRKRPKEDFNDIRHRLVLRGEYLHTKNLAGFWTRQLDKTKE